MSWFDHIYSANWNLIGAIASAAYLLGCFTAGYYLVRMRTGQDIRELGSGNVGARNVGRVFGRTGFVLTVLFDFGKGAFAVWAAKHFTQDPHLLAIAMIAVVMGHVWPAQLKFRGGKGVATSLGALLVFDPFLVLWFTAVFLLGLSLLRRTILPGLIAFACLPPVSSFMGGDRPTVSFLSALAALILIAHRRNVMEEIGQFSRRLIEPKPDESQL